MQEKFTLSSADIGTRLKFIRKCQGITLAELSDDKPSTAQSWEKGKMPHRGRWRGIASQLGVSESLVFFGQPMSADDYAFVAKWRNLISDSESLLKHHAPASKNPDPVSTVSQTLGNRPPKQTSPSTRPNCEEYVQKLFDQAATSGNPNAFPVIYDRLQKSFPLSEWEEPLSTESFPLHLPISAEKVAEMKATVKAAHADALAKYSIEAETKPEK